MSTIEEEIREKWQYATVFRQDKSLVPEIAAYVRRKVAEAREADMARIERAMTPEDKAWSAELWDEIEATRREIREGGDHV